MAQRRHPHRIADPAAEQPRRVLHRVGRASQRHLRRGVLQPQDDRHLRRRRAVHGRPARHRADRSEGDRDRDRHATAGDPRRPRTSRRRRAAAPSDGPSPRRRRDGDARTIRSSRMAQPEPRASVDRGGPAVMTAEAPAPGYREHGNAYNIFILVLTVYSLVLMVLLFVPLNEQTRILVNTYDNAICVIFLIDFADQPDRVEAEARLLHHQARLARPPRVDPGLRRLPADRALPPGPSEPAGTDQPAARRSEPEAAHQRRPGEPQLVRDVHHHPAGRDGPRRPRASSSSTRRHARRRPTSPPAGMRCGGASSPSRPSATATTTRSRPSGA